MGVSFRVRFSPKVVRVLLYSFGSVLLSIWGGYARSLKPIPIYPVKSSWNSGAIPSGEALLVRGGGLSAVAADLAWIQAMIAWEQGHEADTVRGIHAAVRLNPRPHYFWVNGARILAFDITSWRLARLEAEGSQVPQAARAKIVEEQARQALSFLASGEEILGQSTVLTIESGFIQLHARKDRLAARVCFQRAVESGSAPDYVKTVLAKLSP